MKAIIDGFKYDTETATHVFSYMLNEFEKGEMYRNRKYKFFMLHMLQQDSEQLKYEYKIIPITKAQAMDMLITYNKVEEYEKLFGEIPEAEGEDYQEAITNKEPETSETSEIKEVIQSEEIKPDTSDHKVKKIWSLQKKLSKACRQNDTAAIQACIACGAVVEADHIHKAIVNQDISTVELLLNNFSGKLRNKDIQIAIIKGDMKIFQLVINTRLDYKKTALKIARKYLRTDIVQYLRSFPK